MKVFVGVVSLCAGIAPAFGSSLHGRGAASGRLATLDASDREFLKRRNVPPQEVQSEVERMMQRIEKLPEGHDKAEYVNQLVGVEEALAERAGAAGSFVSKELVDEIASTRGTLCVEQGFEQDETVDCETFMRVVCSLSGKPAEDARFAPVTPVNAQQCHKFFQEAQRETEVATDATAAGTAVEEQKDEEVQAEEVVQEAASANGTNGSSGFFGGKLNRDLPEQGYNEYEDGVLVKHPNLHTHTGDWQHEGEGRSMEEICKEFPDNEWCQLHTQTDDDSSDSSGSENLPAPEPMPERRAPAPEPEPKPEPRQEKSGTARGSVGFVVLTTALAALFAS